MNAIQCFLYIIDPCFISAPFCKMKKSKCSLGKTSFFHNDTPGKKACASITSFFLYSSRQTLKPAGKSTLAGSAKANGREPKSCLGRVFNFESGHFAMYAIAWHIQKQALA
jgi:hypothetical protein